MKEKNSFIMRKEWKEQVDFLNVKQKALLIDMIFAYQVGEEVGNSGVPIVDSTFAMMRRYFAQNEEKYNETCQKRAEAGRKGGEKSGETRKKQAKSKQNEANEANASFALFQTKQNEANEADSESDTDTEYDYDYDTESDKLNNKAGVNNKSGNVKEKEKRESGADAPARSRFSPPAVEEVSDYVHQNNFSVDPEAFVDYYKSNDWYVGKHKMKDWKAAVRNWHRREEQNGPHGTVQKCTADDALLKIIAEGG